MIKPEKTHIYPGVGIRTLSFSLFTLFHITYIINIYLILKAQVLVNENSLIHNR